MNDDTTALVAAPDDLAGPSSNAAAAAIPWRLAYGALDLARVTLDVPHAALLGCEGDHLRLLALRGADAWIHLLERAWADTATRLKQGYPYADRASSFVALPCVHGDIVCGVLLLVWPDTSSKVETVSGLTAISRTLGAILSRLGMKGGSVSSGLPVLPVTHAPLDPRALPLLAMLEADEWNVSRVARRLGVTRMTMYNRMKAIGLPRLRVAKSRQRKDTRGAVAARVDTA